VEACRQREPTNHAATHDARTCWWVTLLGASAHYPWTTLKLASPLIIPPTALVSCTFSCHFFFPPFVVLVRSLSDLADFADSQDRSEPSQEGGQLSPVAERPASSAGSQGSGAGAIGMSRSRTLPSHRGIASGGGTDDERQRARVLRKQKRVSAQVLPPVGLAPGVNQSA
jgi:hypothetical protein